MSALDGLIKPLAWDSHPDADHDPVCNEHYGGGQRNLAGQNEYGVYPHPCAIGCFVLDVMGNRCDEDFASVESAKAAAQDDYEQRILSSLNLPIITQLSEDASKAAELAIEACRIIDAAVREGHDNVSDLIMHFMEAVSPARAALNGGKP